MQLKDYSSSDFMEKNNELSVLLQIDRINDAGDFTEIIKTVDKEYLRAATESTPEYLLAMMAQIISITLEKMNVPPKEVEKFKEQIKERKVGALFGNFKGWDVQALRKEADERVLKAREEDIGKLIKAIKSISNSRLTAMQQLMEQYDLDEAESDEKIALYW